MQSVVESWNQVDLQQFFDDIPFPSEDLQSLTRLIREPKVILPIKEEERLIKLLVELLVGSQNSLGLGEEDRTDIRHDLWQVVIKLATRRLFYVASNSSDEDRRCTALRQLSQIEDEKIITLFDKIADDPTTPRKVAMVAKEAKQEAISILMSKAQSEEEIELSPAEAEVFQALNDGLDSLSESFDRLIAAVKRSADDYTAATQQMEEAM